MMKQKIYVIEDDPDIAELVQFNLEREGFAVKIEGNGEKAYNMITGKIPDLIILDLSLPGMSGIEVCKYLRENARTKDIPIIMLTARSQEIDKIIGFEMGADDYITKPFSVRELIARTHALLRRTRPTLSDIFEVGDLKIYRNMYKVTCHDTEIVLTPTEYKLLEALANAKGRVLSRIDLLEIVWGMDYYGETRTVDVHIKRLRDKLDKCSKFIKTVKGIGYRLKID